jgi:hypothetical protein
VPGTLDTTLVKDGLSVNSIRRYLRPLCAHGRAYSICLYSSMERKVYSAIKVCPLVVCCESN